MTVYQIVKRIFDLFASLTVLLIFLPFFLVISIWIAIDSPGGVFYSQVRVGKDGEEFRLMKFRSMHPESDKKGELTIGADSRITQAGRFLRKTKIDEFPQLFNIIAGDMSIVGPRPEVPRYVLLYSEEQRRVLSVQPGLTDYASIEYLDEQELLGKSDDPEKTYISEIMPAKLRLNLKYIEDRNFWLDLKLIFRTIFKIVD